MSNDLNRAINVILGEYDTRLTTAEAPAKVLFWDQPTVSVTEGNSGTKALRSTMRRSSSVGALAVTAPFIQNSAGAADFAGNALPGAATFNFADGSYTATYDDIISGDTDVESDETFGRSITAPTGWRVAQPALFAGTILNDDASTQPATLVATPAPADRQYTRTTTTGGATGKGAGPVWGIAVTLDKPSAIYAKVLNPDTQAELQAPYMAVSGALAGSSIVDIEGVESGLREIDVHVASSAAGPWTKIVSRKAMAMGIALGPGQSLESDWITSRHDNSGHSVALPAYGYAYAQSDETPASWGKPTQAGNKAQYNSAALADLMNDAIATFGTAVVVFGLAYGGSDTFAHAPAGEYAASIRAICSEVRSFEYLFSRIGHTAASQGRSADWSRGAMTQSVRMYAAHNLRGDNFKVVCSAIPNETSGNWGTAANQNLQRWAKCQWAQYEGQVWSAVYVNAYNIELIDGTHFGQVGGRTDMKLFRDAAFRNVVATGGDENLTAPASVSFATNGAVFGAPAAGKPSALIGGFVYGNDEAQLPKGAGVLSVSMLLSCQSLPTGYEIPFSVFGDEFFVVPDGANQLQGLHMALGDAGFTNVKQSDGPSFTAGVEHVVTVEAELPPFKGGTGYVSVYLDGVLSQRASSTTVTPGGLFLRARDANGSYQANSFAMRNVKIWNTLLGGVVPSDNKHLYRTGALATNAAITSRNAL